MPSCGVRASSQRSIPGSLSFSHADRSRSSRSRWPTRWRGSPGRCWPRAAPTGRLHSWQRRKELWRWEDEVASVRSRTAGVMTTLMRNGRDRRLGKPVKCHARKERVLLVGTRSADHIRASGHSGCIHLTKRPDTWLHPNASLKCQIPLAPRAPSIRRSVGAVSDGKIGWRRDNRFFRYRCI